MQQHMFLLILTTVTLITLITVILLCSLCVLVIPVILFNLFIVRLVSCGCCGRYKPGDFDDKEEDYKLKKLNCDYDIQCIQCCNIKVIRVVVTNREEDALKQRYMKKTADTKKDEA